MSVDPNMMAYLLQLQPDNAPPSPTPEMGQHGIGQVPVGIAKGLGKNALALGSQAGDIWDLAFHPQDENPLVEGVSSFAQHPYDTASDAVDSIYEGLSGSPGSFAETMAGFATPHDFIPGAPRAPVTSNIWGGRKSRLYDWNRAAKVRDMAEEGVPESQAFMQTADPEAGVLGYWQPPESWGQKYPWMWIDDRSAELAPGAMRGLNAEAQRQFAQRMEAAQKARSVMIGQGPADNPISRADIDRLTRKLESSERIQDMDPEERAFMGGAYPRLGLPGAPAPTTLGDLVSPKWSAFEHYPGLQDLPVGINPWARYQGGWSGKRGKIEIGGGFEGRWSNPDDVLDTLLHEPSHGVQDFEGMPGGAAPQMHVIHQRALETAAEDTSLSAYQRELARQQLAGLTGPGRSNYIGPHRLAMDPDMLAYMNSTGEANARLPFQVRRAQLDPLRDTPVIPMAHYYDAGIAHPERTIVTAPGGSLYHPDAREITGMTSTMGPRADLPYDLSRRTTGPTDQLSLALRRARQKKPP